MIAGDRRGTKGRRERREKVEGEVLRGDFMGAAFLSLTSSFSFLSMRASNFSGPKLCDWFDVPTETP